MLVGVRLMWYLWFLIFFGILISMSCFYGFCYCCCVSSWLCSGRLIVVLE